MYNNTFYPFLSILGTGWAVNLWIMRWGRWEGGVGEVRDECLYLMAETAYRSPHSNFIDKRGVSYKSTAIRGP